MSTEETAARQEGRANNPLGTRLLLAGLALVVLAATFTGWREVVDARTAACDALVSRGIPEERLDALATIRREVDPVRMQTVAAFALIGAALDTPSGDPAESREALVRRQSEDLKAASALGVDAARRRPGFWHADLVSGAALYLDRLLRRDDKLLTRYHDWEDPLLRARKNAPAETDPTRFLAMAYLEMWPVLSPAKRELTRELVSVAFQDRTIRSRYISVWFDVAGEQLDSLNAIPDEPEAWAQAAATLFARQQFELTAEALSRWRTALDRTIAANLASAQLARRRGNYKRARYLLATTLDQISPDGRYESAFVEIVRAHPPGPLQPHLVIRWLDWHIERCLYSDCRLPADVLERLQAAVRFGVSPLAAAHYALARSDIRRAEELEKEAAPDEKPASFDYWLEKASALLVAGEKNRARQALVTAGRNAQQRYPGLFARLAAQVSGEQAFIEGPRCGHFRAPHSTAVCEFETPLLDLEITIHLQESRSAPSLADVVWDGSTIGTFPIARELEQLEIVTASGELALHRLEVVVRAGAALEITGLDFSAIGGATPPSAVGRRSRS